MAVVTAYGYTLADLVKREEPDGSIATIVEVLNKINPMIEDAPWMRANDNFQHLTVRRTILPSPTRRKFNAGVALSKSSVQQALDVIAMYEARAGYDKKLLDSSPDPAALRNAEARAFIEGMAQQIATDLIYGNHATTPDGFTGLAPRLASAGTYVRNEGGSGSDVTSIYVVVYEEMFCHLIYPKYAGNFGIQHTDLGEQRLLDSSSNPYQGYEDLFQADVGFVCRDPRYLGRHANIETAGAANLFDEDTLITLLNNMKIRGRGMNAQMYCNTTVLTQMDIAAKDKSNIYLSPMKALDGEEVLSFRRVPINLMEAITNTETAIS